MHRIAAKLRLVLLLAGLAAGMDAAAAVHRFTTTLSQDQEVGVPDLVVLAAFGTGSLLYDDVTGDVEWSLSFSGLSGAPSGAHLHEAPAGVNGPVVVDLGAPAATAALPSGLAGFYADSTTLTDPLLSDFATALFDGHIYVNIHTPSNPSGEIRGQLAFESVVVPLPPALILLASATAFLFRLRRA